MNLFIRIFLLSTVLLFSCKKEKPQITISGKIIDPVHQNSVSGARVILSANGINSGIYSQEYVAIETQTTNSSGMFSFELNKEQKDNYRIRVSKDNFFEHTIDFSASFFDQNTLYNNDIELFPYGFLQVRIYNAFPTDNDDKIIFYFSNTNLNDIGCCVNTSFQGDGPAFDTTFTCKFYGGRYILLNRSVRKNQHINVFTDSLYCNPFTTTNYEIQY